MINKARQRQFRRGTVKSVETVRGSVCAFTLIEMLAVMAIILTLVAVLIGTVKYVDQKMMRSQLQLDFASLEVAIDNYKNDYGRYPTSSLVRISWINNQPSEKSRRFTAEVNNSGLLVAQLCPTNGAKSYYQFRKDQTNLVTTGYGTNTASMTVIVDPWGTPINYYCTSPVRSVATYALLNVSGVRMCFSTGGQVNVTSFDLWSYGPDSVTYLPHSVDSSYDWNSQANSVDDITNWK
ncbi:MAG: hypothetical protein PCFJNLEI_00628 [Verrucomicrobiae bacterium]|nr:hypothetical protein [Verrucomicrobiae bacterium]